MKIIGGISIFLLTAIMLLQVSWLNSMRNTKLHEFQEKSSSLLQRSINDFLDAEFMYPQHTFSCSMLDNHIFHWKDTSVHISSPTEFHFMLQQVLYDHLYKNQLLNLQRLDSIYKQQLSRQGITDTPVLYLKNEIDETILQTHAQSTHRTVRTNPVKVGYEYKHTIVALFHKPPFFHDTFWHLILEFIFLGSFTGCLLWQLQMTKNKLQTAKIQSMGIAHLEHELRKPLATLINITHDWIIQEKPSDKKILELIHARLLKISDVTEMMLFALKQDELKIERTPIDIRQELETTVSMFRLLKKHARIDYQIREDINQPLLDNVYFSCVVANLIDNGIKYNKKPKPEVRIYFEKEAGNWILRVEDNGIGIPSKAFNRIFRQFYRIEDKRTYSKTGFGLGLAFIKKVTDAYKGSITIKSIQEQGTVFTIKFPCI